MKYYFIILLFGVTGQTQSNDCVTPDNQNGSCVDVFECNCILQIIDQLSTVIDDDVINEFSAYRCDICSHNGIKVCCPPTNNIEVYLPLTTDATVITTTESITTMASFQSSFNNEIVKSIGNSLTTKTSRNLDNLPDEPVANPFQNYKNYNLLPTICGVSSSVYKITSGDETNVFMYPWMALLYYRVDQTVIPMCGGTIINEKYILTAAHCVDSPPEFVRLGEHDLRTNLDCSSTTNACLPVQDIEVENVITNAAHNSTGLGNADIALIRLKSNIDLNAENTKPICLPLEQPDSPTEGVVTGWGRTGTVLFSNVLMQAQVPVVNLNECQGSYQRLDSNWRLFDTQICAGGGPQDTCTGDSGGPLQFLSTIDYAPAFVQFGITSYGGPSDSCGSSTPGVYTKVYDYIPWILDSITD